MRKPWKRNIAITLLAVLGIILIPREYIHALYGHEDTHCVPHSGYTLEKAHHHCKILQVTFPVFLDQYQTLLPEADLASSCSISISSSQFQGQCPALPNLRAPPLFI